MEMVKKRIALLGATGSIGLSTLKVVEEQSDKLEIVLATAHNKSNELFELASKFNIPTVVLTDKALQNANLELPPSTKVYYGEDELIHLLKAGDYDIALNAISGSAGLRSTMAILQTGKDLALANKESLVMAGHLVKELQQRYGSKILPVDSEHSAIFQAIGKHPAHEIARVHITASGGAFRTLPLEDFDKITVGQALKHPNWDMGAKVTLDSATMFNKALEVMEAHWLFNLDYKQIKAVIHSQSIIHSLVEFIDGSYLAQMSTPDMMLPIIYALSYPERYKSQLVQTNLLEIQGLNFEAIDDNRYPLFYLGVQAGKQGGIMPTVANAANEAALQLFLERKIRFTEISEVVNEALQTIANIDNPDLDTIIEINQLCYQQALTYRSKSD
jgi:1-deoxy-D-xylulose-5-phosphate reductoisomerase